MARSPTTAEAALAPAGTMHPPAPRQRWWASALLGMVAVLAAGWVWRPILGNYFLGDDFTNLFLICNAPLAEYLLTPHAGHVELVRNAVFYASARLFGTDAAAYFLTVLITHLVNVALLFTAVRRFTGRTAIACVAAILFGTCPAVEGSLGWYAVFGHVLVGTALLAILVDVAGLRGRGAAPGGARLIVWGILALAGVTSFGVGVGVAMALPVALAVLLPGNGSRRLLPPLWPLFLLVPAVYAALYWIYNLIGRPMAVTQVRDMTTIFGERTLAVPRFTVELIAYAVDRLLAGPLPLPPYPAVAGALLAAGFAALALWCGLRGRPPHRRLLAAGLLLTLAVYATIGAGRVVLLDVVGRSEALAQLRYHYVGLITLNLALAAILAAIADVMPGRRRLGAIAFGTWLAIWLVALRRYPPAIDHHDKARTEAMFLGAWFHVLARDTPPGEDLYITNRVFHSVGPLFYTRREFPGWAGLFSILFPSNVVGGHRVYFIEPDPSVREAHRHARRLAGVLVAPEEAPPRPGPWTPLDPMSPLPSRDDAVDAE